MVKTDLEKAGKTNLVGRNIYNRLEDLEGSGGGELPDLTAYAKLEDLDTATNFTAINPTLDTPAPEVLDKVLGDLNQKIGSGGGELPDLTGYAKLEDLDTATKFTAINPTLDTPAPEVLDKVVTDIENEVKTNATNIATNTTSISTNTTAITDLTGRVTNLENSGGGGDVFVEPIYIPITSADINSPDASITVDLSAYPDNKSFCIDVDILDTEAIFIINIVGTDSLNGFLEELYVRGNIGFTNTESTKATDLFIEGVRIVGILARVLSYRKKCRYTINGIDNIFYYAKYDENLGYIDAIFCDRNVIAEGGFDITDTTTFFFPVEPLKKRSGITSPIPYTGLAYVALFNSGFEYHLDFSMLIVNSLLEQNSSGNYKYAQDNVQDYLLVYGRRTYLPNLYFPRSDNNNIGVSKILTQTELLYANFEAVSGNSEFHLTPYVVTAIGRFGKVMDVGKMTEQA